MLHFLDKIQKREGDKFTNLELDNQTITNRINNRYIRQSKHKNK